MQIEITDEQWHHINKFIPQRQRSKDGKGRPKIDNRLILNGVLWIMWTGSPWAALPAYYGSRATCHRRFQEWTREGIITKIFKYLVRELESRGEIILNETFIDGSFASAKKGAFLSGKPNEARVRNGCLWLTEKESQSELELRVLLRMKLNLHLMLSRRSKRRKSPSGSSVIRRTQARNSVPSLTNKALS